VSLHDIGDSVLADGEIAGDPAVGSSHRDCIDDLFRDLVGLGALARLSAELLSTRAGGGEA